MDEKIEEETVNPIREFCEGTLVIGGMKDIGKNVKRIVIANGTTGGVSQLQCDVFYFILFHFVLFSKLLLYLPTLFNRHTLPSILLTGSLMGKFALRMMSCHSVYLRL